MAETLEVQELNTQQQLDLLNDAPLNIPVSKLDADQYMADDLDGVTESVFGAGNMGYASLQAAQTDLMMGTDTTFSQMNADTNIQNISTTFSSPQPADDAFSNGAKETDNGDLTAETDRPFDNTETTSVSDTSGAGLAASTVSSLGASELSSNAGSFTPSGSGLNLADALDGLNGGSGTDGQSGSGTDGRDGSNGSDGGDCDDPCGGITINNNYDIDLVDVTNLLNATFSNLNDTLSTLTVTITSLTESLTDLLSNLDIASLIDLSIVTDLLSNLSEQLTQILDLTLTDIGGLTENVTGLLETVLQITNDNVLSPLSETTFNLLNEITDLDDLDLIGDTLGELGGATEILQNIISQVQETLVSLDLSDGLGDELNSVLSQLDILEEITSGLTETIDGAVGGLLGDLGIGDGSGEGDLNVLGDVNVAGLEVPDLPLDVVVDPVEDLIGDIDVDILAATDLLNPFGDGETDNDAGDSDLTLNTDLDIVDTDLLGGEIDVELDAVEELLGDIDLDLNVATDLLGDAADGLVNDGLGGSGDDGLLADTGDLLGDTVGDLLPGLGGEEGAESDLSLDTNIDVIDENLVDTDLDSMLDPVEEVVGDIDLGIGLDTDLLGGGDSETSNAEGDTDLDLGIDLELGGTDIVDVVEDIPLDPVEEITGDIDLSLDGAIDLLNPENDVESGTEEGGDLASWTESTISDGGGLFDDLTSGLGGDGDALPDPVGTVAEGLGSLDFGSDVESGSLGGLFG